MKRAILILSIVAMLLLIVGIVIFGSAVAAVASQCAQSTDPTAQQQCTQQAGTQYGGQSALSLLLIVLGSLSTTAAWIMGLIKTAQLKAWGWFVAVLLVSPLGSLIYGIAGPDQAPMPQYGSPQYPPQQYPPQQYPPQQYPPQQYPQQYPQQSPPQSPPESYR